MSHTEVLLTYNFHKGTPSTLMNQNSYTQGYLEYPYESNINNQDMEESMEYSDQTIREIIDCNFKRLESDDAFNRMLLFIIIEQERNNIQVTKNHILNEFKESKHTISSLLRFMDGLGFISIYKKGKENIYKITTSGSRYLEMFLSTTKGNAFYINSGYFKKSNERGAENEK